MGRGTRVGDSSSGDGPLRPTWEWRDDGPEISPVLGISPLWIDVTVEGDTVGG